MRKILAALCLLICVRSHATQYFFSNTGSTSNNGLSSGSPWPVSKLNFAFLPDDQVLLHKGETFVGTITVSRSGTAGHPIIYSSYGTGAQPVVTGMVSVTAWSNVGANLWESTAPVSTLSTLNMVVINGINTPMGRFPNTGYMTIAASPAPSTTTLSSTSLNAASQNWTGAEVVIRKVAWVTDRNTITSASGTTINFAGLPGNTSINAQVGWGFFIENDVRTLDVQNEWYYNPTTKKIRIFSTSSPTGVQIAATDTLVKLANRHDVTFESINFTFSNKMTFQVASQNVTIQNCTFDYSGVDCIWGGQNLATSTGFIFQNNSINHTNNNAVLVRSFFTGALIQKNLIQNTGLQEGMLSQTSNSNQFGMGIEVRADNVTVQYNEILNSGYASIEVFGNNITVQNNFSDGATKTLADGGNYYTFVGFASDHITPLPPYTGMIVRNNIGLNSVGYGAGTIPGGTLPQAQTFYFDDCTANVIFTGNTGALSGNSGVYFHNTNSIVATGNTFFNNGNGMVLDGASNLARIRTMTIKNNIFVAQNNLQQAINPRTGFDQADMQAFGTPSTIDSNIIARPINDNQTVYVKSSGVFTNYNLAQWVTFSTFDSHSKKSPINNVTAGAVFFAYNKGHHDGVLTDSTITLPAGTWIDLNNVTYNTGSVVLPAYTSIILINTGTNIAPTANAGTNKNITLPVSSFTQVGSGTDVDGTIVAYRWTRFSGPGSFNIVSPNSAVTDINSLTNGTYVFQLQVTDNLGLTGVDTFSVVVNSSAPVNIPPTANAGGNKNITLPTSTVTQVGSGTDPDGSIVSYSWVQVSGPAATIVSPTSATTVINGLSANSAFQLTVTDNLGATGSATATIIVNTAAPIPPVAHAGTDQVVTWPINSVNLAGSGTDADGVIVSYAWSKISGGAATITNAGSQNTIVTGLALGVYQIQLTVTDNSGQTGTDIVQITVNKGAGSGAFDIPSLSQTYDGTGKQPIFNTTPPGLTTSVLLNGVAGPRILAGSYSALGAITDPNYTSTAVSATFTINKALDTILASNQTVNANGNPQTISATTTKGLAADLVKTYNGSLTPPSAPGSYQTIIRLVNANIMAVPDTVILTIVTSPAIIFISDTNKIFNNSPQTVTVTSLYSYLLTGVPQTNAGVYYPVTATINDGIHTGSFTAHFTILKQTPVLSWMQPQPIPYGSLVTGASLNATSNVAGHFVYNFPIGTSLPLGDTPVTATFVPDDPANYNSGVIIRIITVYPVNPFSSGGILISGSDGKFFFQKI